MKDPIVLSVEVPVASFRESRAKDYIATYPVPLHPLFMECCYRWLGR